MTQTQIKEAFKTASSIEEAKAVFKKLAKVCHPDVGGSNEAFKMLNKIYNHIIENEIYFSNDTKFDIELEKIITQILHFEDINIEIIGKWIWVSGETKAIKETLKSLGFKWAKKKMMWYFGELAPVTRGGKKEIEEIRATYGSISVKGEAVKKIA